MRLRCRIAVWLRWGWLFERLGCSFYETDGYSLNE